MSDEKPSWAETMAVALILISLAFLAFFPRLNPRLRPPGDDASAYVAQARPGLATGTHPVDRASRVARQARLADLPFRNLDPPAVASMTEGS